MKATINGITVEGSPQEIMEYERIQAERARMKPYGSTSAATDWVRYQTKITSGATANINGKCPNAGMPCYCTGACTSPSSMSRLAKSFDTLDQIYDKYNT